MAGSSEDDNDDDEYECDCYDRVVPGQYYHCPKCDREWLPDDDDDLNTAVDAHRAATPDPRDAEIARLRRLLDVALDTGRWKAEDRARLMAAMDGSADDDSLAKPGDTSDV